MNDDTGCATGTGGGPAGTSACAYPWQQMIVDLTGEVVPCCFWSGYGNTGRPLGNTNASTLDEIWNGAAWQELRRTNASGATEGTPCHRCVAWRWGNGRYPGFTWPAAFAPETGRCWIATIPDGFRAALAAAARAPAPLDAPRELSPPPAAGGAVTVTDTATDAAAPAPDPVLLFEDDVPLPHPGSAHDAIREHGGGRYSVWGKSLYFSTSDGSDPVTNGRRYELRWRDLRVPLAGLVRESPSGRNLLLAYEEYRAGRAEVASRPSMLSFIATADCNIDCPACSQNTVRLARVQHRAETEADVLAHVPYLHQFIWHGGEPYLIRRFREFVDGFRTEHNPNLTFGFTSNGTMLDAAELEKLRRFPRVNASLSVDSFVPESFARLRAGARFGQVLEHVLAANAEHDAPARVFSVGMIVVKSNLLELPFNLRFALEHDIGLNLSPVVVYPVTERLDVFTDFPAQTRGWAAGLAEARQVLAGARAAGCRALDRVDPAGMLDVLDGILAEGARRHARSFLLRILVTDPHDTLRHMRHPGIIVAREGDPEHPLGYVELRGAGEHRVHLPLGDLAAGGRVGWSLVHDLLEPMGIIDLDSFCDRSLQPVDVSGWSEMPAALHLRVPEFAPVVRPRNIALANRGLPTPDGLHPLTPAAIYARYHERAEAESLERKGLLVDGPIGDVLSVRADVSRRGRYGAFKDLSAVRGRAGGGAAD
ncbi:MAG TPA: SPASM domain-containing protein [Planctomycetota bacterium]|nr:SPASM domain-containing protein [Planctomycetota bacterium]